MLNMSNTGIIDFIDILLHPYFMIMIDHQNSLIKEKCLCFKRAILEVSWFITYKKIYPSYNSILLNLQAKNHC